MQSTPTPIDAPLRAHYDAALKEVTELQAEKSRVDSRLAELETVLRAYELVAQDIKSRSGRPVRLLEVIGVGLHDEVIRAARNQLDACVLLAYFNEGTLRTQDAERELLRLGRTTSTKNSYSIVQHVMGNSELLELSKERGTYKLTAQGHEHARMLLAGKSAQKPSTHTKRPRTHRTYKRTALSIAMERILDENPAITDHNAAQLLIGQGFTFHGTDPIKAAHMVINVVNRLHRLRKNTGGQDEHLQLAAAGQS